MLTNAGKDLIYTNMASLSQAAAANYMALTANATAPGAGDTTLTAEIATGGGGLIRAQGTPAHSNGTSTYTLTHTFTANGSDVLPVVIAKIGIFNASSSGTMMFETLLTTTATISASGDQLVLTETVTLT
jgi:hypothetical protein